jgi:hypothetical protein
MVSSSVKPRFLFLENARMNLISIADWQDGPVPQMPSKNEYVPMYWGPSHMNLWNQRVAEMHKNTPKHIMAFNEPDVKSQSNMDPNYAAQLYMEQIYPWAKKGVRLGSPAIVWNLQWMDTFLSAIKKKGGSVDFICLHWYYLRPVFGLYTHISCVQVRILE